MYMLSENYGSRVMPMNQDLIAGVILCLLGCVHSPMLGVGLVRIRSFPYVT